MMRRLRLLFSSVVATIHSTMSGNTKSRTVNAPRRFTQSFLWQLWGSPKQTILANILRRTQQNSRFAISSRLVHRRECPLVRLRRCASQARRSTLVSGSIHALSAFRGLNGGEGGIRTLLYTALESAKTLTSLVFKGTRVRMHSYELVNQGK